MSFVSLLLVLSAAQASPAQVEITDGEISSIVRERVDLRHQTVGVVVGLIDRRGERVIAYGKPSRDSNETLGADSIFEIASVTKTFTATLLAQMVENGEVSLDDPISRYLPQSVKTPTRNGEEISLRHLATHTSGLPRDPECLNFICSNLWGDESSGKMYAFLSKFKLTRDIGARYEYSNYGMGLLGNILALRAGTELATLLRIRVLAPLNMKETAYQPTSVMLSRLAKGHDSTLKPVHGKPDGLWFYGGGGLYSSVNDMLKFIAANLQLKESVLSTAMARAQESERQADASGPEVGLAWHIRRQFGVEMLWHNGESMNGYRSFVALDRVNQRGVVVLWNSLNNLEDIGWHLLDPRYDLALEHQAVKLDPRIFDRYAGEYQFGPGFVLKITRKGSRFFAQPTVGQKLEIFAEGDTDFFWKETDAQLTFRKNDDGNVWTAILHEAGTDQPGRRIR